MVHSHETILTDYAESQGDSTNPDHLQYALAIELI